jgi:ribonuclease HI
MGAGVAYCPLGDSFIGMVDECVRVGGKMSSLRSEAAALHLLLQRVPPDMILTVLMDSLGLLQTLQKWGRFNFTPAPGTQLHFDIIYPILVLLHTRTAHTLFVKVKSHSGVALNEQADLLAEEGHISDAVTFDPPVCGYSLAPYTREGLPIANLRTHLREQFSLSLLSRLRKKDGFNS